MSAKLATPNFLKIKVFWNKSYDVITSVHNFGYGACFEQGVPWHLGKL